MSRILVSPPGRSQPSSRTISNDPYDQAERGLQSGSSSDLADARQLLETRTTLSQRYSQRSTNNILAGTAEESFELDPRQKRLPRQDLPPQSKSWIKTCISCRQHSSFPKPLTKNSLADPPDDYKLGFAQLQYRSNALEKHPDGYPKLAAFMESSDSFAIYRKFGYSHARLLALHMSNLTEMENELFELDKRDAAGGEATDWRLTNRFHEDGLDPTRRDLESNLEKGLLAYGALLRNYEAFKSMNPTPARDHLSVLKWLIQEKPLDDHEADWINYPDDFISVVPPRRNLFENFILGHLDGWPKSCLQRLFRIGGQQHQCKDSMVKFYSTDRISIVARLMIVLIAVLVLCIPVILFLLTSMSRACMAVVVLTFDFIFSVMISIFTDAGDKEIFVGTATYCAVLVTFLGNLQSSTR